MSKAGDISRTWGRTQQELKSTHLAVRLQQATLIMSFLFSHSSLPYASGLHHWREILMVRQDKTHVSMQIKVVTERNGTRLRTLKHFTEPMCPRITEKPF